METDTWKLHKSVLLVSNAVQSGPSTQPTNGVQAPHQPLVTSASAKQINVQAQTPPSQQHQQQQQPPPIQQQQQGPMPAFPLQQRAFSNYEKGRPPPLNDSANELNSRRIVLPLNSNPKSQQINGVLRYFFVRHGERIDLSFGPQWIEQAFDRNGKYRRVNLNMPYELPQRSSKREFLGDSPITEIGQFQARLTGEALNNEGYKIHYCYVSPALRCIQTAHQILKCKLFFFHFSFLNRTRIYLLMVQLISSRFRESGTNSNRTVSLRVSWLVRQRLANISQLRSFGQLRLQY